MNGINLNEIPLDIFMKYFNSNNLEDKENQPSLIQMESVGAKYKINKPGHIYDQYEYDTPINSDSNVLFDMQLTFDDDTLTDSDIQFVEYLSTSKPVYVRFEKNGRRMLTYSKYVFLYKDNISKEEAENISILDDHTFTSAYRYISLTSDITTSPNNISNSLRESGDPEVEIMSGVDLIKHNDSEYLVFKTGVYHGKIVINPNKYIQETTLDDKPVYLDIYGNRTVKYELLNKMSLQNSALNRIFERIQDPEIASQYRFFPNIIGLVNTNSGKKLTYFEQYKKTTKYEKVNTIPDGTKIERYIVNPAISEILVNIGDSHEYFEILNNSIDVLDLNSITRMIYIPVDGFSNKYRLITSNPEKDFIDIDNKPLMLLNSNNNKVYPVLSTIKPDTLFNNKSYENDSGKVVSLNYPHAELKRYEMPSDFNNSKILKYLTANGLSNKTVYIRDTLNQNNVYKFTVEYTTTDAPSIPKDEFLKYSHIKSTTSSSDDDILMRKELGISYYIKRDQDLTANPFIYLDEIDSLFVDFFNYVDLKRNVISDNSMSEAEKSEIQDIIVNKIKAQDVYNTPLNIAGTSSIKRNAMAVGILEFLNSSPLKEKELKYRDTYNPDEKSYKLNLVQEKEEVLKPIDFIDRKSAIKSKLKLNNGNVYQRLIDYEKFPVNYMNLKHMTDVDSRLNIYNQEVESVYHVNDIMTKNKKSYLDKNPKLLDYREIMTTYMVNYFKYSIDRSNKENIRESFDRFYKNRILNTVDKTITSKDLKELYIFSSNTMDINDINNYEFLLEKLDMEDQDWRVKE